MRTSGYAKVAALAAGVAAVASVCVSCSLLDQHLDRYRRMVTTYNQCMLGRDRFKRSVLDDMAAPRNASAEMRYQIALGGLAAGQDCAHISGLAYLTCRQIFLRTRILVCDSRSGHPQARIEKRSPRMSNSSDLVEPHFPE